MPGWVDRLVTALSGRDRRPTDVSDCVGEERRTAIRTVRDALRDAMTFAEQDREHGRDDDRAKAIAAADLASTTAHEVDDDDVRSVVAEWRRRFDAIPKGWFKLTQFVHDDRNEPGYPEPAWSELRETADAAQERIGALLRGLLREG